jgi:hypothetical protein
MANDLTAVIPKLLAQGLLALRENAVTAMTVNRGYEALAGERGSTIDVPIPSAIAAVPVVPGNVAPDPGDLNPTSVPIVMDKWDEASFQLSDKDQMEVMNGTIPMQASEAIKSLVNSIDQSILNEYKRVFGAHGTPGSTPFVGDTTDVTETRKILQQQLAPQDPRWFMVDVDAEANALNLRAFQDASWVGSAETVTNGTWDRRFGFGWAVNQNLPTHTAGTADDYTVTGANAIGATTLAVTSAANNGTFLEGDIIRIAGDDQTYVVTQDELGAPAASISIQPALRVATTGAEAITVEPSHAVNLAYHRDAFALAMRPLTVDHPEAMSQMDPVSGLSLRLEVVREHKRTRLSFDALWGVRCVRPELAARLMG